MQRADWRRAIGPLRSATTMGDGCAQLRWAAGLAVAVAASGCYPSYEFDLAPDGGAGEATHRMVLRFDGADVATPLAGFPVLVRLNPARIDYATTQDAGQDLRFFAADGTTPLPHEIERWDESGESLVWVRVPEMAAGGSMTLLFGDPTLPDGQRAADVWADHAAVYHLDEDPTASPAVRDSTGGHDGTAQGFGAGSSTEGRVGSALAFDGADSGPSVALTGVTSFSAAPGQVRVVGAWFARSGSGAGTLVESELCCVGWGMTVLDDAYANTRSSFGSAVCCPGTPNYVYTLHALPDGAADVDWHHAVTVLDRQTGALSLYVDAELYGQEAIGTTDAADVDTAHIGAGSDGSFRFSGTIDEVRIGTVLPSVDWLRMEYRATSDGILTYGAVETL